MGPVRVIFRDKNSAGTGRKTHRPVAAAMRLRLAAGSLRSGRWAKVLTRGGFVGCWLPP
jgi:hypothetical protein